MMNPGVRFDTIVVSIAWNIYMNLTYIFCCDKSLSSFRNAKLPMSVFESYSLTLIVIFRL